MTAGHDEVGAAIAVLRGLGLRVTPQRQLLVEISRGLPGHFTAEEVYERMRATLPAVSKVSVYRGLETLCQHGLVSCTSLGSHAARYEWVGASPHHHLVCSRCGHVEDVLDAELDPLRAQLAEQHDFRAEIGHFAIWGTCRHCSR